MSSNPAARAARRPRLDVFLRLLAHPSAQLALSIALSAVSQVWLKLGAAGAAPGRDFGFGWLSSGWVWLGIAAMIGSLFSWLYVLRTIPLSIAFAFAGAIHILVPLGSWLCLGETISGKRWLGIVLVTAGVLVSAKPATAVEEKL